MTRPLLLLMLLGLLAVSPGCMDNPRDNPWDGWKQSGGEVNPPDEDSIPPVQGNAGAIDLTVVNPTSVSLSWTKANDAVTQQEDLEYRIVQSNLDNISTPDDKDDHGIVIQNWSADIDAKTIGSLTSGSTYYFNIVVRDKAGNRAAYQRAVVDPLGVVYIFSTSTLYNGNLGGRSGADAKCKARYDAAFTGLNCTTVKAFISVNGSDEIRDMPGNYGVPTNVVIYGPTGLRIGINWADLLDGTIERSMADAGVETSYNYWTGSNSNGSVTSINCSGWSNDGGFSNYGEGGSQSETGSKWLQSAFLVTCNMADRTLLCVCW